jgi:hypothetical protein
MVMRCPPPQAPGVQIKKLDLFPGFLRDSEMEAAQLVLLAPRWDSEYQAWQRLSSALNASLNVVAIGLAPSPSVKGT